MAVRSKAPTKKAPVAKIAMQGGKKKKTPQSKVALTSTGNRGLYFDLEKHPVMKGAIRVKGQDWLGRAVLATSAPGTNMLNLFLSPASFGGTRLATFANMYEKYCFRSFVLHYEPSCAAVETGALLMAYDPDISDATPPANDEGIRTYLGMQSSVSTQVWTPIDLAITRNDPQSFFYTSRDPEDSDRLAYQGQIYVAVMTSATVASPGTFWVEYVLDLYDPTNEKTGAETKIGADAQIVSVTPNAAWNNFLSSYLVNQSATPVTGPAGYRALFYQAGQYVLDQFLATVNVATNISPPTLVAAVAAQQPQATVQNLDFANAGAGGNAYRSDRITIPRGGAWAYGNVTASTTPANSRVRTFSVDSTFV